MVYYIVYCKLCIKRLWRIFQAWTGVKKVKSPPPRNKGRVTVRRWKVSLEWSKRYWKELRKLVYLYRALRNIVQGTVYVVIVFVNMTASLARLRRILTTGRRFEMNEELTINHMHIVRCTVIVDRKRVTHGVSSTTEIVSFENLTLACYQVKKT